MIGDIREHLKTVPFVPFTIRMASGHDYYVPTIDHIWIPPGLPRVVIATDEGITAALPGFLISGLLKGPIKKRRSKRSR